MKKIRKLKKKNTMRRGFSIGSVRNRAPGYNANGTLKKSKKSNDGHLKLFRSVKGTDDDSCSASS